MPRYQQEERPLPLEPPDKPSAWGIVGQHHREQLTYHGKGLHRLPPEPVKTYRDPELILRAPNAVRGLRAPNKHRLLRTIPAKTTRAIGLIPPRPAGSFHVPPQGVKTGPPTI